MSNKKTAVEWLQQSMLLSHEQQMQFEGLFQQAKAMEREQIMDAFGGGRTWNLSWDSEEYYNEIYKQQDNEQ